MPAHLTRREALASGLTLAFPLSGFAQPAPVQLATFSTEVTPPLGHPCMGGGIAPVAGIDDPLFIKGLILLGPDQPVVIAAIDWCEIRNDAYTRWRDALARAAGTIPERVLLSSVHQHDAPIADLAAQRLLDRYKAKGEICDLAFHERTVTRVARSVAEAVKHPRRITHVGTGKAEVKKVASNRRYLDGDQPRFGRTSATRDPRIRAKPEGTIDPYLRTLSFWEEDRPVSALSCYATHPMSYYGKGRVSSDFVGLARKRRQADDPSVFQIYASGCSGNVTAGKYNDGSAANRPVLAERIYQGLAGAWKATRREKLTALSFRSLPLRLEPRNDKGFTVADLTDRLKNDRRPFGQCLAALGLSWRRRADAGHRLDVPVVDLGTIKLLLLPAESYVEYQLWAQQARPDVFVMTLGYGECAPGYIPTEQHFREHDSNLRDWCWVAPGCEKAMKDVITRALAH
jgi:hypothetical protein